MALINCSECGKEISDKASQCPNCGYPLDDKPPNSRVGNYTPSSNSLELRNTFKKQNTGKDILKVCSVMFVIFLVFTILSQAINSNTGSNSTVATISEELNSFLVFDALSVVVNNERTLTESELIEKLGEPDYIDEWNFEASYQVLLGRSNIYPIRSLYYGNYEYMFNNDVLQRISIEEEIPYSSHNDILKMFGLKKYSDTEIINTNFAYRATKCGIPELWVQTMTEDNLNNIKLSYSNIWSE